MTDIIKKKPPNLWQWFQRVAVTVALIASLATVFSVWRQVKSSAPHITATVTESESLTKTPNVPKLKSSFSYDDRTVSDFWRLRLSFINDGEATIIGDGVRKNIVKDSLIFSVDGDFEILGIEVANSNFSNKVNLLSPKQFEITFLQWRKAEDLGLRIYLEKNGKSDKKPKFYLSERPIIDGDITIIDNSEILDRVKKPAIDYCHPLIATSSRAISATLGSVFLLIYVIAVFIFLHELKSFSVWRKHHLSKLLDEIKGSDFDDDAKEMYRNNIEKIPAVFWKESKIPEPDIPTNYSSENHPYRPTVVLFVVMVMLLVTALVSLACILRF
ncbi:hypothetical protein ACFLQY_01290 [Verrucomicrobiota bacterium]